MAEPPSRPLGTFSIKQRWRYSLFRLSISAPSPIPLFWLIQNLQLQPKSWRVGLRSDFQRLIIISDFFAGGIDPECTVTTWRGAMSLRRIGYDWIFVSVNCRQLQGKKGFLVYEVIG